jgi:phosphatidylglycerol---prolipoprotein diacylglyceryl transferase
VAIAFPDMDPVALAIGPLQIHWYALSYVAGFLLGWALARHVCRLDKNKFFITEDQIDDFMTWAILGIILGGRIGYVLFYNLPAYMDDPVQALKIWQGGMAWHGGLIGTIVACLSYCYLKKIPLLRLTDIFAVCAPIGFFLGRIANFINGELYGRVTTAPWGVIFPAGGLEPRHPSQLYQSVAEGLLLLILMVVLVHRDKIRHKMGVLSGIFLIWYGLARFGVEFFREPDAQLGFIFAFLSMGQILCLPMIAGGLFLIFYAVRRSPEWNEAKL